MEENTLIYILSQADGLCVNLVVGPWKKGGRLTRNISPISIDQAIQNADREDARLLMRLKMAQMYRSDKIRLQRADGYKTLCAIIETGRAYHVKYSHIPLSISAASLSVKPTWKNCNDGRLKPTINDSSEIFSVSPPCRLESEECILSPLKADCKPDALAAWLQSDPLHLADIPHFMAVLRQRFPDFDGPVPDQLLANKTTNHQMFTPVLRIELAGANMLFIMGCSSGECDLIDGHLRARLSFRYADEDIQWNSRQDIIAFDGKFIERNAKQEALAIEQLKDVGATPPQQEGGNFWAINRNWHDFLDAGCKKLASQGWQIERPASLDFVQPDQNGWYADLKTGKSGWYDLEIGVTFDNRRINLLPVVVKAIRSMIPQDSVDTDSANDMHTKALEAMSQQTYPVLLADGRMLEVPGDRIRQIVENLIELHNGAALSKNGKLRISGWRAAELTELEHWSQQAWKIDEAARNAAAALQKYSTIRRKRPKNGFNAELREYQRQGLGWMEFLLRHGLGGILADDMGLGKTIQTLAMLHNRQKTKGNPSSKRPTLIVAPRSVLYNWLDEGKRFAPELNIKIYHGPDRHTILDEVGPRTILITTYAIIRNDVEKLSAIPFDGIILDEAHVIKNDQSQSARCLFELHSVYRFCLTGTPIHNHLGELWSLINFLLPAYLGTRDEFNQGIRNRIEKENCPVTTDYLRKRMQLFILRRTKDAVAKDLPPKTETVQRVHLTTRQRETYQIVRTAAEKSIREAIADKGLNRSQFAVLTALLRLRQTCCDPRLVPGAFECTEKDSAKLQWLHDVLPEMLEDGRRILIFSQFVGVLNYIAAMLQNLSISFSTLTGSTPNREEVISGFQNGKTPLFLISLKAGGVGLNLTAADTVIHYDPWWNPAIEQQATDRAYRIGQDKPVFVYKLIAAGTVEERILKLQQEKAHLVEHILTEQAPETLKIDSETIEYLLAPMQ